MRGEGTAATEVEALNANDRLKRADAGAAGYVPVTVDSATASAARMAALVVVGQKNRDNRKRSLTSRLGTGSPEGWVLLLAS